MITPLTLVRRSVLATAVLTSIFSVSGCSFAVPRAPSASDYPVTSSPTATGSAETPTLAEGVCDRFLPVVAVQSILGTTVAVNPEFTSTDFRLPAAGGIGCTWMLGQQGGEGGRLSVAVVPVAVGSDDDISAATSGSPACDDSKDLSLNNSGCHVSFVTSGWWVEGTLYVFTNAAAQEAAATRLVTQVRAALVGASVPTVSRISGSSCADVDAAISPSTTLGLGDFLVETDSDSGAPPSATADAVTFTGQVHCGWTSSDFSTNFDVSVFPRSLAVFNACANSASAPSSVPGVRRVVTFYPGPSGVVMLCATDGVSSVVLGGLTSSPGSTTPFTTEQLAEASKILTPALLLASK